MRMPAAVASLSVVLLVACGQATSPTAPGSAHLAAKTGTPNASVGSLADQEVPFKGRFEGFVTVVIPRPPLVDEVIEATGNATRLGRFELEIPHTINVPAGTLSGTYQLTAANGDTITAQFTGQSHLIAPGVVAVVDNATITGGTGRFANATGSFTVNRTVTFSTLATSGSFEGTMSTIGANRQ